jgi:hypothetical protein
VTATASVVAEKEDNRALIISGGNTVPVFQAAEHDLDANAALIGELIVVARYIL